MSEISPIIHLHSNLLGGCSPCLDANPEEIISRHCDNILGNREVHMAFCLNQQRVYFLVVPSRVIEPGTEPATPLVQALPAHPKHQGDGIYRVSQLGHSHIVIKNGATLRVLSNFDEVISDYIGALNMQVFDVTAEKPEKLYRLADLYRVTFEKFKAPLQWLAILGILVSTGATAAAKLYEVSKIELPDTAQPIIQKAELLTGEIKTGQPLFKQLARFDAIGALTIRAGGWIEYFRVNENGDEQFRILLPEWVSRDYIEAMGNSVITDLAGDGLIQAVKGDKPK